MTIRPSEVPDAMKRLMSKDDRKKLGDWGLTAEGAQKQYSDGQEKELQKDIDAYLVHCEHKPYVLHSPFGRKTTNPGQADYILCYRGLFVAIEAKCGTNKQSDDQIKDEVRVRLSKGIYRIVKTVGEVKEILRYLDSKFEDRTTTERSE